MTKIVLFLLMVSVCTIGGYYGLEYLEKKSIPLEVFGGPDHSIPDFQFVDQMGREFKSQDHNGQIWVVHYFFTSCPSICPKMVRNLEEAHARIRQDDEVVFLSLTVDPKRDNPERLLAFANKFNVDHNHWYFLTGEKTDLYRLARKSFLIAATDGDGGEDDFIHSENIVVIDKNRKIRAIVNGIAPDAPEKILNAIEKLKKEDK